MKINFDGIDYQIKEYPICDEISYVKDFKCRCGKIDFLSEMNKSILCGYTSTQNGYMAVFECPYCFSKSRFHINTTGRYDLDKFKDECGLILHLYNNKKTL